MLRRFLALIIVFAAVVALPPDSRASCAASRSLTSAGGIGYFYIYTPGVCPGGSGACTSTSLTNDFEGFFWTIGAGDPAIGLGTDNGSFLAQYPGGWLNAPIASYAVYIGYNVGTADWSAGGVDGCPDSAIPAGNLCTAMLLNDQFGGEGFFALLSDQADGGLNYDLDKYGFQINLSAMPVPTIGTAIPGSGSTTVTVNPVSVSSGLFEDPGCNSALTGYKVYSQNVGQLGAPPVSRDASLWTVGSAGVETIGQDATVDVTCSTLDDLYFAVSLVFDSGFETPLLGGNSASLRCDALLGDFGNAVPFASRVVSVDAASARSVHGADVDGDGDMDMLSASSDNDTIAWYENNGASPPVWTPYIVTTSADEAWSVFAADVDGDGDMDVLSASRLDDTIAWYENDGASPPVWTPHTISTSADEARRVFAVDLDGDGDMDVLSASSLDDKIAWYESDGASPPVWTPRTISTAALGARAVFAIDVDGDDDVDVLSASIDDDKIAWYESNGASPPVWTPHTISTGANGARNVFAADVDGDGDIDVLSASRLDDKIAWYESDGASPPVWTPRTVTTNADEARGVSAADVDGDGHMDVLSASGFDDKIAWYQNNGASPPVWVPRTISTSAVGANSVLAADLDGDGDIDVLSASQADDQIAWYENRTIHRNSVFPTGTTVHSAFNGGESVSAGDLDGDGDIDIVSGTDQIDWHENTAGDGSAWTQSLVSVVSRVKTISTPDLDGDGDLDILWMRRFDPYIGWAENTAGDASAWTAHNIPFVTVSDGTAARAADIDGDGDLDVVSTAVSNFLAWHENTAGDGSAWTQHNVLSATFNWDTRPADLDGDGDMDLLCCSMGWFNNTVGDGSAWAGQPAIDSPAGNRKRLTVADLDGDGDLDVALNSFSIDTIYWYENAAGDGSSWTKHTVSTEAIGTYSIHSADTDGDGDVDLLSANQSSDSILQFENAAGDGSLWNKSVVATGLLDTGDVFAADIDGDGRVDLASYSGHLISWYRNRGGQYGFTGADVGAGAAPEGEQTSFLAATLKVNGRSGDSVGRFGTMELLFTDTGATPLTSGQANAVIKKLHVYRDQGSGVFEFDLDVLLLTIDTLALNAGVQSIALPASEPNVLVAGPATFFVVGEMTTTASDATPSSFRVTHLSDGGSTVYYATAGIRLAPAFSPDFESQTIVSVGRLVVDGTTDAPDVNPGDGVCATAGAECALRAAIQEANAIAGDDRIVLDAGTYNLTIAGPGTEETDATVGDLDLTDTAGTLTISGAGAGVTIIDANGIDRIFDVSASVDLILEDLTVVGGIAALPRDGGAGLRAQGGNTITIRRCEFQGNLSDTSGAAVKSAAANLTIEGSVFHANTGGSNGTTIDNDGDMTVINSTVSGNQSLSSDQVVIENAGTLSVIGSTVANNQGGIRSVSGTVDLENTIVAGNESPTVTDDDVNTGTFTSAGHNLIGETSSGGFTDGVNGDQVGSTGSSIDPRIEPLGDYGGTTLTHSLKPSSPAIDAGSCGALTADQRGEPRPVGIPGLVDVDDGCDIGAFEAKLGQTQAPLSIPVRWCGLNGAPSIDDPSLLGETSADDVLRARHENVADNIYSDQANVSFVSAANENVPAFPMLDDTMCDSGCPSVGPGSEGDIFVDPDTMDFNEFDDLIAACRQAWQALDPTITGVTAVQIDRFVDDTGTPIGILGIGGRPAEGDSSEQAAAGRVAVVDRFYRLDVPGNPSPPNPEDLLDQLLGHELGHAVSLRHGDGVDNDGDLIVDNDDEKAVGAPRLDGNNLMQYRGGTQLSAAQGAQIRTHVNATVPDVIVQPLADAIPDATPIEASTVNVLEHGYDGLSGVDVQNAIVRKFRNSIVRKFEDENINEFRNSIVRKFKNAIVRRFEYAHVPQFGMAFTGDDPSTDNVILHASTGSLPWPAPIEPGTHYHFYLDLDCDDATGGYPGDKGNPSDPGRNFPGSANFAGDPDVAEEAGVDMIVQVSLFSVCGVDTCDSFSEKRVFDYNDGTGEYEELPGLFENDVDITARGLGLYQEINGDYVELEDVPAGMTIQPQLPISVLVAAGWSFQPGGEPGFVRMEVVTSVECSGNVVNGDPTSAAVDCQCTDCSICPEYPGCVAGVGTPNTLGGDGTQILADCKSGEVTFEPPALPQCALSPALAAEGDPLTAYLTQLPNVPAETVELALDDTVLGSAPTSSIVDGALAVAVTLPAGVTGEARLTAGITGSAVGVDCIATVTPTVACPDSDGDELCDGVDTDDDNDGVADGSDPSPLNPLTCGDSDGDACDDCVSGTNNPNNDGVDFDNDGACDSFDTDDDNDGVVDGSDCAPLNGLVSAIPGEVTGIELQGDKVGIVWDPPSPGDGGATTVQILSGNTSTLPVGGASETCLGPTAAGGLDDFEIPAPGVVYWYLARRSNVCGAGTYGVDSNAVERISAVCP